MLRTPESNLFIASSGKELNKKRCFLGGRRIMKRPRILNLDEGLVVAPAAECVGQTDKQKPKAEP